MSKTIYAYVDMEKANLIPDEEIDVANSKSVGVKAVAQYDGDSVGKLVQNYEFDKQTAKALNGFVKAGAVFFDTAEEARDYENKYKKDGVVLESELALGAK